MNEQHLQAYIKAINKIDDYFEYANESLKDRAYVHKVLAELTEELIKVSKSHTDWRTMQEWNTRGRYISKGEKCKLRDPDGNCLWSKDQTSKSKQKDWDLDTGNFHGGVDYDYDGDHSYGEYMYGEH